MFKERNPLLIISMFVGGFCAMEALPWGEGHGGAWQLSLPCIDGSCSKQHCEMEEEPVDHSSIQWVDVAA